MHQSIHEEIPVSEALEVNFRIYEDSNHLVPNHWHDSLEVVYLYQGTMKVTIADKAYLSKSGRFYPDKLSRHPFHLLRSLCKGAAASDSPDLFKTSHIRL